MTWCRNYYILKTMSGDAIGVVSTLCADDETGTFNFSLHRPEYENTAEEFLDVIATIVPYSEYETHKDVFETIEEVEIVKEWVCTNSMSVSILVRKANKP